MIALPVLAMLMVEMIALLLPVVVIERMRAGGCLGLWGHGVDGGDGRGGRGAERVAAPTTEEVAKAAAGALAACVVVVQPHTGCDTPPAGAS
jgi:hypothetical protein